MSNLLQPKHFINNISSDNSRFMFKSEHIILLCDHAENILREQPIVLKGLQN